MEDTVFAGYWPGLSGKALYPSNVKDRYGIIKKDFIKCTGVIEMSGLEHFDISNTVLETLGIRIVEFTRERVVASMPVTPKVHQPFGIMHGGVSLVLAETVASMGSYLFIDAATQRAVGLEINANHIRSKSDGEVRAIGIPVHVGNTTMVWDIRVLDENERLICISRCTMAIIDVTKNKE